MNAVSASVPRRAAAAKITTPSISVRKLADQLVPRNHAGKGYWDNNADIPLIAWLGGVVFAFVFLVALPWLGSASGS